MTVRIDKIDPEVVLTPRQRFRALLEQMTTEHPAMSAGELADLVAETLPDDDMQLVQEFLASEARTILAYELRAKFSQTRNRIYQTFDLRNRDAPPVRELSERRQNTLYERIEGWREFVPSENRTRPLLDMNRAALLDSAEYDLRKTFTFGFKGMLKQRLAAGLTNDEQTVADVYTDDQIIDLTERVKKEMSHGNFRLKIRALDSLSSGDRVQGQGDGRRAKEPGDR